MFWHKPPPRNSHETPKNENWSLPHETPPRNSLRRSFVGFVGGPHETTHRTPTKVGAEEAPVDEIAKLKAELEALNLQCQLARDHEIRYALQRTRLETGRMQLMLKIVDAVMASPEPPRSSPYLVVMHEPPPAPAEVPQKSVPSRQKRKPDGLPTIVEMVLGVLEGEEAGMRPRDITRIARLKWWPDLRPAAVGAAAWKLYGEGRLEKDGHFYKLNGHSGG
jgi:hypothetical protein